jgi:hypothetical protein
MVHFIEALNDEKGLDHDQQFILFQILFVQLVRSRLEGWHRLRPVLKSYFHLFLGFIAIALVSKIITNVIIGFEKKATNAK